MDMIQVIQVRETRITWTGLEIEALNGELKKIDSIDHAAALRRAQQILPKSRRRNLSDDNIALAAVARILNTGCKEKMLEVRDGELGPTSYMRSMMDRTHPIFAEAAKYGTQP